MDPIICIGQQPNGILPKRFFMAKLETARKLQEKIGGKIVWFCHDSDHDYRETKTSIPSAQHPTGSVDINFPFANKLQRQFTPLAHKSVNKEEMQTIRETLRHLTSTEVLNAYDAVEAKNASEFCIQMYEEMDLLKDVSVVRSSDPEFRKKAETQGFPDGYFYDTIYEGELVRAELHEGRMRLHKGGELYWDLGDAPDLPVAEAINPGRDRRFMWMQSVIKCTHYITGKSEQEYLKKVRIENPPEFIVREKIENQDLAWIPISGSESSQ